MRRAGLRLAATVSATVCVTASSSAAQCDKALGEDLYASKCALCHSIVPAQNGPVGPGLFGVVGRRPATSAGFSYSVALKSLQERWSPGRLDWFLEDPSARVPGTAMAFSGLRSAAARRDLICFLGGLARTTPE